MWYRTCHHRGPSVRVPFGPVVTSETVHSNKLKPHENDNNLCMCTLPDGYYLERVSSEEMASVEFVEKEVVEMFFNAGKEKKKWRMSGGGEKYEGKGKGKEKTVLGSVKNKVKEVLEEKLGVGGKGKVEVRVFRWVPREKRVEGKCGTCEGLAKRE
ncbi:hypothetical protein ABW19_dt0206362 [Dactylella cylindrospora]|nr:hypothetical protein ABW19_dt0206362 [Dactylella cylindrospora]